MSRPRRLTERMSITRKTFRPLGRLAVWLGIALALGSGGCSRRHYRVTADRDVRQILQQKSAATPWQLPALYNVYPDPRARFADPTAADCPRLPGAVPQLNAYTLPPLVTSDPRQGDADAAEDQAELGDDLFETDESNAPAEPAGEPEPLPTPPAEPLSAPSSAVDADDNPVQLAAARQQADRGAAAQRVLAQATGGDDFPAEAATDDRSLDQPLQADEAGAIRIAPIPRDAWENLPASCLGRMFEFDSVRQEYRRSFHQPAPRGGADVPRLSLANIMELAQINSREYQARKEALYAVALRLTRERYQFELRPTPFGNGTSATWRNTRVGGITTETLAIPTDVAVQKTLATGGQFLASFANDVVLTFNGPQGFSADVGSALLFDFQQTIFQTDVRLESLTQAERDVVYAARDLVRFRRGLFRDLAGQYYSLLLAYRGIEINSQDYFSNLRAYLQGRAEYVQAGRIPRVQVDQFEQNALRSRSNLVSACNSLETSLDRLKLAVGLPPEMPVDLRLDELEALSLTDELTVSRELLRRTRLELEFQRERDQSDLTALINAASVRLMDRLTDMQRLARRQAQQAANGGSAAEATGDPLMPVIAALAAKLGVLEAGNHASLLREELADELKAQPPQPLRIFYRSLELIEALAALTKASLEAQRIAAADPESLQLLGPLAADVAQAEQQLQSLYAAIERIDQRLQRLLENRATDDLPVLVQDTGALLESAEALADRMSAPFLPAGEEEFRQTVLAGVAEALQISDRVMAGADAGLTEIEVEEDPAMMTALVQRLDLMNRRAELADARRAVKIAADDLRSILDLRASQTIRTRSDANTPLDFSFDDSETRLSIALDTPLNRRAQRNNYRLALIDYNATLRNLIASEDVIKLDVRQDLRQLRLRRDQYEIAIASAALAYERVVSTRLQLQLALGDVVARDFLEAQQAYTAALSSVAQQHINYILDRIELFFDLEAIQLDPVGYWPGLRDEQLQPPVNLDFPSMNPLPYDRLVPGLHYSDEIRNTE